MKIALIGYGKMGREVERVCAQRKNTRILKIITEKSAFGRGGITKQSMKGVDAIIDFSSPRGVLDHIQAAAEWKKNIVVGTTGWYDGLPKAKAIVRKANIGLLYSPNFSLGMNVFFGVVSTAAKQFAHHEIYDVAVQEIHHKNKADSPSGTALTIGELILREMSSKKEILTRAPKGRVGRSVLHISSTRVGDVAGTHTVIFDSTADSVELIHTAKNRSGFALGALLAAEWLIGKKGVFTMEDVFR